ncbi:MAG: ribosome maturation factor RimP [Proteobacteria bacterium]|nr:ribosome maturation factor RimP [Pseudomonadota bacterium]
MDERAIISKLEGIIQPVVEKLGLELYDLEYKREGQGWVVRVFINSKDGVTIDDCVKVSRQLNLLLDVEDIIPYSYNLEVSSPGLTRTLKKTGHYEKSIGAKVKVKLREPLKNMKTFVAVIKSVEGTKIFFQTDDDIVETDFSNIESAKLQLD